MVMQKLIICWAGLKKPEETSESCKITSFSFQYWEMASENQGTSIELSEPYYFNEVTIPDTRLREATVRIQDYGVEKCILSFDSKSVRLGWLTFLFIPYFFCHILYFFCVMFFLMKFKVIIAHVFPEKFVHKR